MSLILDALNRSSQDQGETPSLSSRHGPDAGQHSAGRLPWLLGAALLGALVVIAWLLLDRGEQPEPVTASAEMPAPSVPAPVAPVAPVESAVAPAATAQPTVVAPPPTSEPEPVVAAPTQADPAVSALYAQEPAATTAEPATVAEVPPQSKPEPVAKTPEVESRPEEQPLDLEALVSQAQEELGNASLAEHPAPFLASLSQRKKDSIPTILYQRHDYSGRTGESSVVLNGKQLRPGAKVVAGVRLDEILPDSIVLSHQGKQFRLRALNSWVNL